jgi:hypothetical protein
MTGFRRGDPFQVAWRYIVTHAAAHNGSRLGAVLGRGNTVTDVWRHRLSLGSKLGAGGRGAPSMDKFRRSFHIYR